MHLCEAGHEELALSVDAGSAGTRVVLAGPTAAILLPVTMTVWLASSPSFVIV